MLKYSYHLTIAKNLLSGYKPPEPFHVYLKKYYSQNKKHGSRDRKLISALCYDYFRLGFALKKIVVEEKIVAGFFLCETSVSTFLEQVKPEWNNIVTKSLEEKLLIIEDQLAESIFPFGDELSDNIDGKKFSLSFLQQPKLFLKTRPGHYYTVIEKLAKNNLWYEKAGDNCIALPNAARIDTLIDLDKEAVVQDYNSQRVGELLQSALNHTSTITVWDCCAASGGKSIMAYDIKKSIELTVSDKRNSILENLKKRFAKAGIQNYFSFMADLSGDGLTNDLIGKKFNLVIADVPCTGSGTWSRTPEQLCYFDKKQINKYAALQKRIVKNVATCLQPGGYFLYITCSVFAKENEEIVDFIKEKFNLNLLQSQHYKGYEMQADTMFAALFMR